MIENSVWTLDTPADKPEVSGSITTDLYVENDTLRVEVDYTAALTCQPGETFAELTDIEIEQVRLVGQPKHVESQIQADAYDTAWWERNGARGYVKTGGVIRWVRPGLEDIELQIEIDLAGDPGEPNLPAKHYDLVQVRIIDVLEPDMERMLKLACAADAKAKGGAA